MGYGSHGHGHSHGGGGDSHSHGHEHSHGGRCSCSKTVRLVSMMSMTIVYFFVELVVGHKTKSLALIADSFHMLSDVVALCIGLFAVRISSKRTSKNTFGWARAEVLGALVNSVFLLSLCISIVIDAVERVIEAEPLKDLNLLLITACIGLGINLIGLFIFGHGHSHSVPPEAVRELENENEIVVSDVDDDDALNSIKIESSAIMSNAASNNNNMMANNSMDTTQNNSLEDNEINKVLDESTPINKKKLTNSNNNNNDDDNVQIVGKSKTKSNRKRKCCSILSSEANLNLKAVFLHVLADALGSVVVIICALLNKYHESLRIPEYATKYIDPVLSLILVALILASTIPLFKETALILLQTVPKNIIVNDLKEELMKVKGVASIHELHIWRLSENKIIASVHIRCHNLQEYMQIAIEIKNIFHEKGIHSTTIQPEFLDPIAEVKSDCILECKTDCNANTCCGQSNGFLRVRTQKSLQEAVDTANTNNQDQNRAQNM